VATMKLPQRTKQHKINTKGLALVTQLMADDWIIRNQVEEDYGIDLEIEFVKQGQVTGGIAKVQLKFTETSPYLSSDETAIYLPESTANYYLALDLPLYLFLADLKERTVYWINVQRSLRRNWKVDTKLRAVRLHKVSSLLTPESKFYLIIDALSWRSWRRVYEDGFHYIADFANYMELANRCDYADSFMALESDELDRLKRFDQQTRRLLAAFAPFEIDRKKIPTLAELEQETVTKWKMHRTDIPYGVAKRATEPLSFAGFDVCKRIISVIIDKEQIFWMLCDLDTFNRLSNLDFPDPKSFADLVKWALRY
jgi:hypothetical protein